MTGEVIHQTAGFPPMRVGMSTNDFTDLLPKQRWAHQAKGLLLLLPRTGAVVVPYESTTSSSWNCVVMHDPSGVYPRDGYNISVGAREIETAIELPVPIEVRP